MTDNMNMDEEKKTKMMEMLKELGLAEDQIDEKLMWVMKKASFKLMKLRLILDEKGVDETKAKAIINKAVNYALERDLSKIKEWHQEHMDEHKQNDCCHHCGQCHHDGDGHEHKESEEK